jgi:hypothetical protein
LWWWIDIVLVLAAKELVRRQDVVMLGLSTANASMSLGRYPMVVAKRASIAYHSPILGITEWGQFIRCTLGYQKHRLKAFNEHEEEFWILQQVLMAGCQTWAFSMTP